jgi:hypothetical protein
MSNLSRRRVVVLRDFSYTERQGEEELAIERFLRAAPEQIDISVQPPDFVPVEGIIRDADVLISFGIKRYPDRVFEWLLAHPRHVHVAQDWWESAQPQSKWRNRIIQQASAVIFMSPLHQERYERICQAEAGHAWIIPFPMLESDWAYVPRVNFDPQEAVLWCAPWHPDYGNDIMLRWAVQEKQQVHAHGLAVPTEQITPLVKGCGPVALDVAAPSFAPYSRFAFFPRVPVPFGFTFLLAYMLGLEMTYSGEVGCLSWERGPEELVNLCDGAPNMLWDAVEEVAA